uniref:Uncharacterized protein n=1 Tax=Plectus sambesii TaxID=2011161 RepID=A0A914UZ93_9BILA
MLQLHRRLARVAVVCDWNIGRRPRRSLISAVSMLSCSAKSSLDPSLPHSPIDRLLQNVQVDTASLQVFRRTRSFNRDYATDTLACRLCGANVIVERNARHSPTTAYNHGSRRSRSSLMWLHPFVVESAAHRSPTRTPQPSSRHDGASVRRSLRQPTIRFAGATRVMRRSSMRPLMDGTDVRHFAMHPTTPTHLVIY